MASNVGIKAFWYTYNFRPSESMENIARNDFGNDERFDIENQELNQKLRWYIIFIKFMMCLVYFTCEISHLLYLYYTDDYNYLFLLISFFRCFQFKSFLQI